MTYSKKILTTAFILFLFFAHYTHSATQQDPAKPLREIMNTAHSEGIETDHWQLYTKATERLAGGKDGYRQLVEEHKAKNPEFTWDGIHTDEQGHLVASGSRRVPNTRMRETYRILAYKQGSQWMAHTIYQVDGKAWHEGAWRRFLPKFQSRVRQDFTQNVTFFTCVSGRLSGNIDRSLYQSGQSIVRKFSAEPVEQLKEKTFVSLSAYANQWKPSIRTGNQKMNLQVALRSHGDRATKVTIGTPIITTEY